MSQHLWEHYLYSGDKSFLSSVYPVLKGAAMFYADYLIEHPKYHWLVICPDESPENAPKAHQGSSIDAGVTMLLRARNPTSLIQEFWDTS